MAGSGNLRSSDQCHAPDLTPSHLPIVGQISFHHLIIYLGTICAGLAIIISIGHIFYHALNCYRVAEQKYLMRVITVIPAFVIISTLGSWWYPTMQYLQTVPEIVEAVALVSLFQLFVQQATGTTHRYDQDIWFANLERHRAKKFHEMFKHTDNHEVLHNHGSLRWYRAICICIYQFPLVKLLWTPILIILTAVFCPSPAKSGKTVKVFNGLVNTATTSFALTALILFYSRLRPILKPNHAFRKAFVLKKLIGIVLLQAAILSFVEGGGGIHPTDTMSFGDFTVGIPAFMSQVEFFFFAIGFLFCYNVKEYKDIGRSDQESGMGQRVGLMQPTTGPTGKVGFFHAIIAMLNITDLLVAIGRAGKHIFELRKKVYTVPGQKVPFAKLSPASSQDTLRVPLNAQPAPPAQAHAYADQQQPYGGYPTYHHQGTYSGALAPSDEPPVFEAPPYQQQQYPNDHHYQPYKSQYPGPHEI